MTIGQIQDGMKYKCCRSGRILLAVILDNKVFMEVLEDKHGGCNTTKGLVFEWINNMFPIGKLVE